MMKMLVGVVAAMGIAGAVNVQAADAPAADGQKVYQSVCAMCHRTGVAGAPKLGDVAAWEGRIAQGIDVLYERSIKGFKGDKGTMPARGGRASLSDAEVKAAVDYIVEQSSADGGG
jgi:cytochrome c5